jgi:hypothetical protein
VPLTAEQKESRRAKREAKKSSLPVGWIPAHHEKVHVPRIMSPDPMIFPPKLRLALQYYLDTYPRDAGAASDKASMEREEFKAHLHSPGIREWLREQEDMIDEKLAELRAKARIFTEDHLDSKAAEILDSATTLPSVKVKLIEVGYRRFGMLRDKVEATGAGGAPLTFQLVRIGSGKKESDAGSSDTDL